MEKGSTIVIIVKNKAKVLKLCAKNFKFKKASKIVKKILESQIKLGVYDLLWYQL